MATQIRRELRKLNAFGFFWMFLPVIPILVPYQLSLGLNMQQVFFVQVFFGLVCAAFEVPSGYLSDLWGRKGTLLAGTLLWGLGFGYLYFVKDFTGMLIYEGILGLAVSLVSGTDVSMLYDWLKQESQEREVATKTLANYQMSQVLSEALAGVLCGLLVLLSYRHVLAAQALVALLPIGMVCFLKEPSYEKLSRENHWQNLHTVWRHVFHEDRLLRLIFLNQIVWSLATFVMVWLNQKLWQAEGIPLGLFGLLWTLINLVVGFTGRQVSSWEKRLGSGALLLALSSLPILGYALLALSSGGWVVLIGLFFPLSRGITQILLKDAINWRTPSAIRATVLSLNSLLFRLGFALLGPLTGWVTDTAGLRPTLWMLALLFGLAALWVLRPLLKLVKELPAP
ncbi:hypothetical protein COW36_21545 [bacterium (Candidatus Blackallbacteria) CG17_big_fil_post_rev_8_21_14_2_50_48_46]|uniref:Major facilitator superfamily (MFS) profile domain-containing protein n=1 Tax=bacterium (Candidatus Blackallbacteria) CG17_big_fil_post_rev_8_21_14_2_50_48_46 TaxID=2014261 RepID=A0A2M7FZ28_9BACT|nr:MAG: hypothetical protein COW64_14845 [bacterium (Candidatus Blackallbacteria) CG18_big_fil_WC_8_21_14_2_50_49_26]PIW14624.1 MAG: hypothetical protein COW36_21545 [bacterium (Candidatus Blackallbacteria) CG17_big_fil_post_rev_8_21_14_2_50_48_46]PIW45675.1 MAG: hypothetical protein COW20_19375 [bacterium (Candidatus Blackallbacteria) CG13_big_fil_rev_8_21_14_2_50_49_14]